MSSDADGSAPSQRLDKWLWTARFFKTRALAAEAVSGGKVQLDGQRVKPARRIRPGASLRIRRGDDEWDVVVEGLARQRRPAPEARQLYTETPESLERRVRERERRREEADTREAGQGRPTKRDRREMARLRGR